jgi:hypothetical protein
MLLSIFKVVCLCILGQGARVYLIAYTTESSRYYLFGAMAQNIYPFSTLIRPSDSVRLSSIDEGL